MQSLVPLTVRFLASDSFYIDRALRMTIMQRYARSHIHEKILKVPHEAKQATAGLFL